MSNCNINPKTVHAISLLAFIGYIAYIVVLMLRFDADQIGDGVVMQAGPVSQLIVYTAFFTVWTAVGVLVVNRPMFILSSYTFVSVLLVGWLLFNLVVFVTFLPFLVRYHLMWLGSLILSYLYMRQFPQNRVKVTYLLITMMVPLAFLVILREQAAFAIKDNVVRNEIYWLLPFLPWCFAVNKRIIELCGIALCGLIVAWTAKRGAVVAIGAMLFAMYFIEIWIRAGRQGFFLLVMKSFTLISFGIGVVFIADYLREGFLLQRLSNILIDEGTGRFRLYAMTWESIGQFTVFEIVVGKGYYSSMQAMMFLENSVHNDWLQIIHDFGLLGLGLYLAFHIAVLHRIVNSIRRRNRIAVPLAGIYAYFICLSIYSIGIFSPRFVMTAIALGAFVGFADSIKPPSRGSSLSTGRTIKTV